MYIAHRGAMTVTQIDLDDDALAEAMRLSGARSVTCENEDVQANAAPPSAPGH